MSETDKPAGLCDVPECERLGSETIDFLHGASGSSSPPRHHVLLCTEHLEIRSP